ncbi:hypothetical protein C0993_005788 [Termitomyces sp. T159_Od127]|nr:hypothetical protein C0993_005788 [Termitomyces sp. T159_Od127]
MVKPLPAQPFTYYDILGIEPSASVEDVRKAYRRKALETHPDKLDQTATHGDKRRAEKSFRDIREAFDVLGDAQKRKDYDARMRLLDSNDSNYSEYLEDCLKDRDQWNRKRQEEASRSKTYQKPATDAIPVEQKVVSREVQEIIDAINAAIDEVRPGWLERLRRAQEIKANFQSQQASQRL